jgi:hypothetical protein
MVTDNPRPDLDIASHSRTLVSRHQFAIVSVKSVQEHEFRTNSLQEYFSPEETL